MAFGKMATLLGLLAFDSDEKKTLENLAAIGGSFGASSLVKADSVAPVVQALLGRAQGPEWLSKLAKYVLELRSQEQTAGMVPKMVQNFLESREVQMENVYSVLRKIAPLVDIAPEGLDDSSLLVAVLDRAATNVVEADDRIQFTGMVRCPRCQFTHLV